jgi:thiosulfate reductase/polysulfide reductase chain A
MSLSDVKLTRRKFLATSGTALAAASIFSNFSTLRAVASSKNDLRGETKRKFVYSSCGICVNKCGLIAEVNDGIIRKLNPNPHFFKSRGMLCARGNAGAKIPYDPDRLKKPLIRIGERGEGKFKEVSWDEAYDYIVNEVLKIIKKYENRSTIAFASTEGFQEEFFINLANIVGSANTIRHPTLCLSSNIQGYSAVYGTYPDADLENADFVIMAGSNRAEALVTPDSIDMAKKHKKQTLIYIDPRATKTVAIADKWYPIKPGTDLALVLAMINIIITENLYNKEFVEKYTHGFDELVKHIKDYTPKWASAECEIEESEIYWLAREFAKHAPRSVWYPGRRSSFYLNDVHYRRACGILNAIVGAFDTKGALVPKTGIPLKKHDFFFPLFDFTRERIDAGVLPFIKDNIPEELVETSGLPTDRCAYLSEKDGSWIIFREAALKNTPYPIKGLFVYKQNFVETLPNRKKSVEFLKQMDFICTIDVAMSDTAWFSDVVLPESTYLERWDPAENLSGVVPIVVNRRPVIEPLFDTKSMHQITVDLAKRFYDLTEFWEDSSEEEREILKEYIDEMDVPMQEIIKYQLSDYPDGYKMLEEKGVFYETDEAVYPKLLDKRLKTRTGKIELYNVKYAEIGLDPLPVYRKPSEGKPGQFRFIVGRHGQFTHSSTQNNIYLLEAYGDFENSLWINEKVAKDMGLKAGDKVKVKSKVGEQTVKVLPTKFIRPEVVYYVLGFGRLSKGLSLIYNKGASEAEILVDYVETISGNACMHETFVEIEKV